MKRILKLILLFILTVSILGAIYFISKWNKISYDENIDKSKGIKILDKKIFQNFFLNSDLAKVKTDFELFENKSDTVSFNFNSTLNPKYPNLLILRFNRGDGYSWININVLKYKNYFYTTAESYTDVVSTSDFLESEPYIIKQQKLTLNKSNYKKGDSIYGKIELEIKFTPNDSIYNAKGYFRSLIE